MEKTITQEEIRSLTEKGLKLADALTEDTMIKRVKALLDSEK